MLLVHLSDIHFRLGEMGTSLDPFRHLREECLTDLEAQLVALGNAAPDAILVSGDIAYAGRPEEYEFAQAWLQTVCERSGAKDTSVFVIPGNHDVVRAAAQRPLVKLVHDGIRGPAGQEALIDSRFRAALQDGLQSRLLFESIEPYNAFASQYLCEMVVPERPMAQRDLRFADGSLLRLIGLNSVLLSSVSQEKHKLAVDPAALGITRGRGVVNVVLCHHPYSWLLAGDSLQNHLRDVAALHLFGHQHQNRVHVARDFMELDASAVQPDAETAPGWMPGYNLVELRVDHETDARWLEIRAHVREWQHAPGRFRPKLDRHDETAFVLRTKLAAWRGPDAEAVPVAVATEEATEERNEKRGGADMDSLREVSLQFFRLTLSQKAEIAGRLQLLDEADADQPDFERFRRAVERALDRGKIQELAEAIRLKQPS